MAQSYKNCNGKRKLTNDLGQFQCSTCSEWKYPSEYNKNKQQKSGLSYDCRPCARERVRGYNLPKKYGITAAQFAEKVLAQGSKCACCGRQFKFEGIKADRPCVDHNHKTGEIRDILCGKCNLAAGNVNDSAELAQRLADYLKKWNTEKRVD